MIEPHVHIAYAPRGAGLLCAAFWFAQDAHVYGWYTGARGRDFQSSYFVLENYYAERETAFYRSRDNDVRGRWLRVSKGGETALEGASPVPEPLEHELARLQDAFVREWLLYRTEATPEDIEALRARKLPLLDVNVRPSRLDRLHAHNLLATYSTPGADLNIIAFLGERWSLNYAQR